MGLGIIFSAIRVEEELHLPTAEQHPQSLSMTYRSPKFPETVPVLKAEHPLLVSRSGCRSPVDAD